MKTLPSHNFVCGQQQSADIFHVCVGRLLPEVETDVELFQSKRKKNRQRACYYFVHVMSLCILTTWTRVKAKKHWRRQLTRTNYVLVMWPRNVRDTPRRFASVRPMFELRADFVLGLWSSMLYYTFSRPLLSNSILSHVQNVQTFFGWLVLTQPLLTSFESQIQCLEFMTFSRVGESSETPVTCKHAFPGPKCAFFQEF